MVLVGQSDSSDIPALAMHIVEAAEYETVLNCTQLREPVFIHGGERVAFGTLCGSRAILRREPYQDVRALALASRPNGCMRD